MTSDKDLKLGSTNCTRMTSNNQYGIGYGVCTFLGDIWCCPGPLGASAQWSKWLLIVRKFAQLQGGTAPNHRYLGIWNSQIFYSDLSFTATKILVGANPAVFILYYFCLRVILQFSCNFWAIRDILKEARPVPKCADARARAHLLPPLQTFCSHCGFTKKIWLSELWSSRHLSERKK